MTAPGDPIGLQSGPPDDDLESDLGPVAGRGKGALFEPSDVSPPLVVRPTPPAPPEEYESFEGSSWAPGFDAPAEAPGKPATGRTARPEPPVAPPGKTKTGRVERPPPAAPEPSRAKTKSGRTGRPAPPPVAPSGKTKTGRAERPPAALDETAAPEPSRAKTKTGRVERPAAPPGAPAPSEAKTKTGRVERPSGSTFATAPTSPAPAPAPAGDEAPRTARTKTGRAERPSGANAPAAEPGPGKAATGRARRPSGAAANADAAPAPGPTGADSRPVRRFERLTDLDTGSDAGPAPFERSETAPPLPGQPIVIQLPDSEIGFVLGAGSTDLGPLDPGPGARPADDSGLHPFESARPDRADRGPGLRPDAVDAGEGFGRRTAEVDLPATGVPARPRGRGHTRREAPPLPELEGSGEGPIEGLLDSAPELEPVAGDAPAPQGPLSRRLVQASVERVVGLWEGDLAWVAVSVGGALVGPALLFYGRAYYLLPKAERTSHPLDPLLSPSGSFGLWFGIAAAALFLLNLTYVLRRRLHLVRAISLRVWLNVHFMCGLAGASLVLAHCALLMNNRVAVTCTVAIAGAVASGVFGRYVLAHLPRRRDGATADLDDRADVATRLTDLRRQLRKRLKQSPALRSTALAALVGEGSPLDASGEHPAPRGLLYVLPMIAADVAAALRLRSLRKQLEALLRGQKDPELRKLVNEALALARVQRLEQRLLAADAVQDLMDTWRGLHFVLALVVVVTMLLHVYIVITYGKLHLF